MVAFGTVIKDASISDRPKATLRFGSRGPRFESWTQIKKIKHLQSGDCHSVFVSRYGFFYRFSVANSAQNHI